MNSIYIRVVEFGNQQADVGSIYPNPSSLGKI